MILHPLAFVHVLRAVVVAGQVHGRLRGFQHRLQSLHQLLRRAVLTDAPDWEMPSNDEIIRGRCGERRVDPMPLLLGDQRVGRPSVLRAGQGLAGLEVLRLTCEQHGVDHHMVDLDSTPHFFDEVVVEVREVPTLRFFAIGDLRAAVAIVVVVTCENAKMVLALQTGTGEHILEGLLKPRIVHGVHAAEVEVVSERQAVSSADFCGEFAHRPCNRDLAGSLVGPEWLAAPIAHDQKIQGGSGRPRWGWQRPGGAVEGEPCQTRGHKLRHDTKRRHDVHLGRSRLIPATEA
mmetsp:Transcript_40491/g.102996  ORF Transcript_40491/g.102996 Transcript_40491/m.102996 type:complete len:290 (-) Transcript_40491:20-889(-)